MRHQQKRHRLGRTASHRKATLAALSTSLIEHKRITTTVSKAKALRVYIEPLITRCKEDTSHNRRQVFRRLQDNKAVSTLFGDISEHVGDRPGGYTRVVKLGRRAGDGAPLAIIELVDYNDVQPETAGGGRTRTRRSGSKSRRRGKSKGAAATQTETDSTKAEKKSKTPKEAAGAAAAGEPVVEDVSEEDQTANAAASEGQAEEAAPVEEQGVEETPAEAPVAGEQAADAPAKDQPAADVPTAEAPRADEPAEEAPRADEPAEEAPRAEQDEPSSDEEADEGGESKTK